MWPWIFAFILIGIPAAIGAYDVAESRSRGSVSRGLMLSVYAIALSGLIVYLLPTGYLLNARWSLIVPTVLLVSLAGGYVSGYKQRRHDH